MVYTPLALWPDVNTSWQSLGRPALAERKRDTVSTLNQVSFNGSVGVREKITLSKLSLRKMPLEGLRLDARLQKAFPNSTDIYTFISTRFIYETNQ